MNLQVARRDVYDDDDNDDDARRGRDDTLDRVVLEPDVGSDPGCLSRASVETVDTLDPSLEKQGLEKSGSSFPVAASPRRWRIRPLAYRRR